MTLFHNTYRVESSRLKGWDYSSPGMYFITIVTKNRKRLFGDVVDGKMVFSPAGKIADQYWREITNHFYNCSLDEFVIMPNHVHGIIFIDDDVGPSNLDVGTKNFNDGVGTPNFDGVRTQKFDDGVETPNFDDDVGTINLDDGVGTTNFNDDVGTINLDDGVETPNLGVSTTTATTPANKRRANIAIIVNQYKRICTINIRKTDTKFAWQSRFYDHIIRDYEELQRIRHYIRNNPKKWHKDDQRGDAQI